MWRDGMGRVTIKADTGQSRPHDFVVTDAGVLGVCRAPGWVIVRGQATIQINEVGRVSDEWLRSKARKHWWQKRLPQHLRDRGYGPPAPDEYDGDMD